MVKKIGYLVILMTILNGCIPMRVAFNTSNNISADVMDEMVKNERRRRKLKREIRKEQQERLKRVRKLQRNVMYGDEY